MSSPSIPPRPRRVLSRRRNALRPLMEPLEGRIQLSVTPVIPVTAITNSSSSSGVFNQSTPSVAMDANGDYVVTWVDDLDANGYTDEIEAQVFNSSGTSIAGPIEVNSSPNTTDTGRTQPAVAMDANGDFVVAWSLQTPQYDYDIEARRFSLSGTTVTPEGSEFQVNTTQTTTEVVVPTVAMDGSNFVVGWVHNVGVNATVHARLYSYTGTTNTPITGEFNVSPALRSFEPDVAMDANGDFVFTWDTYNPTADVNNVFAQIYNASGTAQGSPIEIDSTASTINPAVAMNATGEFVIGYEIYTVVGNSAYSDVYAQQYQLTGSESSLSANSLSGDVEVYPQGTTVVEEYPSVAIDSQGFATVVWDDGTSTDASDDLPIDAIRVNPNGTVIESSPIQVAPPVVNLEYGSPKVAAGANGDLAFAWQTFVDVNPTAGYGENIDERAYEYVNNAPTINTLANQKIDENGSTTVPLSGITAGGNEEQTLTVTASSTNTSLIVPTVTYTSPNSTGTLNLAPIAGQSGTATITVTVKDSGGTANGGVNSTSVQFTLTVVGPPTANLQTVPVAHDSSGTSITLTGSDPNLSSPTFTYAEGTAPAHGSITSFNTTTGAVVYKPDAGYHGSDSFTFTVTDADGTSAPATVTLNVAVGTPTAISQTIPVLHDSAGTPITLSGSDDDTPALTQTFTVVTQPTHGMLSGTAPNLTYTPAAGYHGTDSFTYTDSNGTNTSAQATVTLIVAVGTPTANGQTVPVAHDSAGTSITLTSTDDDTPALTQTFTVVTQPTHGTLSGTAPNLTYKPTAGYHGSDSFTFNVSNGTNTSTAATVTLNVAVGTPTANGQTVLVAHDSTGTPITLTGSDDDTPALTQTFVVATQPAHGTLSGTAPNLTYTPAAGYHGTDSFTFTDSNGTNTSAQATVTLIVAVGTPTANAQSLSTSENTALPITLTGSDDDTPALTQTFTFTQPADGTVTVSGAAGSPTVVYTPKAGYTGPDSFTFTVSNGTNTSALATVSIDVTPAAQATISGTVGVTWGTAGTATLLTNAGDGLRLLPAGRNTDLPWQGIDTLSITLSQAETLSPSDVSVTGITIANYGPVTISGSGTNYTITLAQPINAADRVTVTIGNANIATFTRRLDVLPGDVNDDGVVTSADVVAANIYSGMYDIFADITGTGGVVTTTTLKLIRSFNGTFLPPLT